jgi:hypothetical protein
MEIDEIALLEILRDMAAVLEQCVQDVDRLYGALSPDDPLHDVISTTSFLQTS